ncbi:MAG: SufD family Fe-S cluster assembly protein [Pseudomonadota bacterium]
MNIQALRDAIPNANPAELELIARYAMLPEDPRRERSFSAFSETGLPHRRLEAWKWTDFKAGLPALEGSKAKAAADPFAEIEACRIHVASGAVTPPAAWPKGLNVFEKTDAQAFGAAEDMPLGALTAALSGQKGGIDALLIEVTDTVETPLHFVFASDGAEASFARVTVLVRPGASAHFIESHLGGAGFSSHLIDIGLQAGGRVTRTVFQAGHTSEVQAVTADIHLHEGASYEQTTLAFGARVCRLETRLTHRETGANATLNAAYLAGDGQHVDITTHVRHGAEACTTKQVTKGAVVDGGTGVFQGKFMVPRAVGQKTDADMQHHALLLEDGAVVNAKPELEIYADDVECAHGNTCGALDGDQLFYMRQRGIPEPQARALLTEAFIAEALSETPESLRSVLEGKARGWLDTAFG